MKAAVAIPIPHRLASRPRWHGLPIPYIAMIRPDGEPEFRVTNENTRIRVLLDRQCQLCGQMLGRNLFFVGGPKSAEARAYFEPPAHLDCLMYAMQVCPFIAGSLKHDPLDKVQAENPEIKVQIDASYTTEKSEWWVIVKAVEFELMKQADHTILVRPLDIQFQTQPLRAAAMTPAEWQAVQQRLNSK